ncbi:squalene synthetase-like protein [Neocucurbitaria cava]|uniref:Protein SQS1 n=1 Tax=Neocucurbitaria cava TaxID=798079 RepID=A0A9W9CJD5_9PLEO|nr:squalene synthetase-like protein [Neocucurbitaria cava]
MSRKKGKSKAKGAPKSTPHSAPSKRHSPQSWQPQQSTTPGFSLVDEARWMSNHRTAAFEAGKRLRHMPVQFISAGHLEGTIKGRMPVVQAAEPESGSEPTAPSSPASAPPHRKAPDHTHAMAQMAIRSPSPAASDTSSSADEVLFRGRGQVAAASATETTGSSAQHTTTHKTVPESLPSVELSIRVKPTAPPEQGVGSDTDSVVQDHFVERRGGKPVWEGTTTEWQHRSKPGIGWLPGDDRPDMDAFLRGDMNPRDAAMDDYMQNVEDFGLTDDLVAASGFARREMDLGGGSHNEWESVSGSQEEQEDDDSWDSDMIHDFADISTSSDVMDTVARILSKRSRKTGLHYLCVYEGSVTDDARWLPSTFLKSDAEKHLIEAFEEKVLLRKQQQSSGDSMDEDGEDDEDDDNDGDAEFDGEDHDLDDETIARILQKQEELGLGSDEVMLYPGDDFFAQPFGTKATSFGRPNKKRQSRVRGNQGHTFPSASAMADALAMDPYGGFDIMDTDRPSLKPKKKGRRGQMPPELEDPDLNEQLQSAWAADRAKKRIKKAEREELRQQGLLGRKGKVPNLKVKYQGGMEMQDVVDEIREFLFGDMQTLALPPMDAHRRATIHQASQYFNLTSRSRGSGLDRFTVLSKTSRTRGWTDDEFDHAIQQKGFLRRLRGPLHTRKSRPAKGATVRHGGARARPQTGYKDGDTVGANAPELGPENKGHALLKRMGWSKGMGLGAIDNKGILQPIPHTVKTSKAGLQYE